MNLPIDYRIRRGLERTAARFRRTRFFTFVSIAWVVLAAVGLTCLCLNWSVNWYSALTVPILLGASLIAPLLCSWFSRRSARDLHRIAERIEAKYPELETRLLAAIEQEPELPNGRFGFLQESVIREAHAHGQKLNWDFIISKRRLSWTRAGGLTSLIALTMVMASLIATNPPLMSGQTSTVDVVPSDIDFQVSIKPGDTEVERGTSLLVLARFRGPLPPEVVLNYDDASGNSTQLAMSKSLDDPVFAGRIAAVSQDLSYRVEFSSRQSKSYQVQVFEFPELKRADAKLVFPEYTSIDNKIVEDVRRITAVEGTRLTLTFHLNKPIGEGTLSGQNEEFPLTAEAGKANTYVAQMTLTESRLLKLNLVDSDGRANRFPPEFRITVTANRPADLKLAQPSRDVQVSPLEELHVKASAWDDFGLNNFGLTYSLAGQPTKDVLLGQSAPGKQRHQLDHLVPFESLAAEPDQLLSYHFWAEDVGPDGKPRRTLSDMYFAEVRHFEEIFREGQQPPGGSQQQQDQQRQQNSSNTRAANQLAELQKQIINATWKVIRREISEQPTDKFTADTELLKESQSSALVQATELAEQVEDYESKTHVLSVQKHMLNAIEHLTEAAEGPAIDELRPALAAEQSAYQALLKLRAREHRVMRNSQQQQSQPNSSSRNQSSRFQQQLQQLELRNSENRYEMQQSATQQQQETEAQREDRQVLNRLRELARRQTDLNKRIKELQSQLQEAQTEKEREDIQKQLKRLRDEEQQILRDTDELRNRMDQPQNEERMAEARDQLEQTREHVRQTSEALEQGMVTQAAASGTRAERQLSELRDDFRRQTAQQFSDEMKQMRDDARQLAKDQQQLAEKLDELAKPQSKSLRETGERQEAEQQAESQRQKLDGLLDRMESTIQEADQTEPLLSKQLYDALRDARQSRLKEAMDATKELLRRGFPDEAQLAEKVAHQEIDKLKQGIERAAESVLGDESESLRRALDEVQQLQKQLDQEIARADPQQQPDQSQNGESGRRQSRNAQQQDPSETEQRDRQRNGGGRQQTDDPQQSPGRQQDASRQQDNSSESRDTQQTQSDPSGQPSDRQQESSSQSDQSNQQPQQGGRRQTNDSQQPRDGRQNASDTDERGQRQADPDGLGGFRRFFEEGNRLFAPLTGADFRQWSDRLRDVEEMIDDPELRAKTAGIRERARAVRVDLKRHSKEPNWNLVRMSISQPLSELQQQISEELLRRQSKDALVPIDRDPVPPRFTEKVRKYYERLGSGK